MRKRDIGSPRVTFSVRIPAEYVAAIEGYAQTLSRTVRIRVTTAAAGGAVMEAGLAALGLIPASGDAVGAESKPAAVTPEKGGKRAARKP